MANYSTTLTAITDRRQAPVAYVAGQVIGTDSWDFYPGKYYDVDNVWELLGIKFVVTTDATVANRIVTFSVRHAVSTNQVDVFSSANVPASQSKTMYIGKLSSIDDGVIQLENYMGNNKYGFLIGGDSWVRLAVTAGVAGDLVKFYSRWRYLNWELGMASPSYFDRFVGSQVKT